MHCGNIKFKPGRGTRGQEATGRRDTLACRVWLVFTASKHQAYYSYFGVILLNNSIENIKPGPLCEDAHKMPAAGHEDVLVNLVTITTAQRYFRSYGISDCTNKVDSAVTAVT